MLLKMAFRNIFRNKNRSILTIMAVIIGITGLLFGFSYFGGVEDLFIREGKKLTGDIRITTLDYELKEKTMDTSANVDYELLKNNLKDIKNIKYMLGRIKFGSIMYNMENDDEKAMGFGIENNDYKVLELDKYIYKGRFLDYTNEGEVVIGDKLAKNLKVDLGDEITVITSTANASMFALNYKIVGIYKYDNDRMNRGFYITLKDAQYLLDIDGRATEFAIYLKNDTKINKTKKEILNILKDKYLIKKWNEVGINQYMSQMLPVIKAIFIIILGILSGVVISNTMMMTVFERKKEMGILKAMGMSNFKINLLFLSEGIVLGLIGSLIGLIIGGSLGYYLSIYGIHFGDILENVSNNINLGTVIYTKMSWGIIINVFIIGIIIAFISTFLAILPQTKKEIVENLRN
ncbi:putative ABC transport system permease protein [Hypnocyclicus thermotrophus]|uniref:ABC transport system permease protein n=1 Tax=Hypnocyclicus thermotrophus TaxID=1627895 RepID=A0AA46I6I3_9FUSO|nr:FtsX-like permease family protein [Hypnocyclicus thermotrophus]TDT72372.1 putative ABC transport system permease protein [Hypnocyclicus thermotrophus]